MNQRSEHLSRKIKYHQEGVNEKKKIKEIIRKKII